MPKNPTQSHGQNQSGTEKNVPMQHTSRQEMWEPVRLFDDLLRPSRFLENFLRGRPLQQIDSLVDVEESDKEFLLSVDLPGFKKDDINIECSGNQLTISAERIETEGRKRASRRYFESFYRSFALPHGTEPDQIRAECEDGVLTVHVPKMEESKPKRIEINLGNQAQGKNQAGTETTHTH